MGAFTIEFQSQVLPRLQEAVNNAMGNEVARTALSVIENSANDRIYRAYQPSFVSRRYSFTDDGGYTVEMNGNTLTITATSELQNLYGGNHTEDLGDIIAEGWENFNMPFERPWMDEGVSEHIQDLETALMNGLHRQGY